jgi:hypothetical protein
MKASQIPLSQANKNIAITAKLFERAIFASQ